MVAWLAFVFLQLVPWSSYVVPAILRLLRPAFQLQMHHRLRRILVAYNWDEHYLPGSRARCQTVMLGLGIHVAF
jgi:hypothetical protein